MACPQFNKHNMTGLNQRLLYLFCFTLSYCLLAIVKQDNDALMNNTRQSDICVLITLHN
jgi:hypothetical protein